VIREPRDGFRFLEFGSGGGVHWVVHAGVCSRGRHFEEENPPIYSVKEIRFGKEERDYAERRRDKEKRRINE